MYSQKLEYKSKEFIDTLKIVHGPFMEAMALSLRATFVEADFFKNHIVS